MNGAMAELWVRTIRTPKPSRMMIIGRSQNFFLSFMKAQSSTMKSRITRLLRSELPPHVRPGPRLARQAIARGRRVERRPHRVLPQPPENDPERREDQVEEQPQDDPRVDPAERAPQRHPGAVWMR